MLRVRSVRPWLTLVHRWTGLALLGFLVIVGATGALLPFQHSIQHWIAPHSVRTIHPPTPDARPLDWLSLHAIAEQRGGGLADMLPLHREPDEPATFDLAAPAGKPPLAYDTIVLDPYSGAMLARAKAGDLSGGAAQIMPFLYRLHTSLALGEWGAWLLGVAALAWTVDCIVGFYLTLPAGHRRWWQIWRQAWKVRLPSPSSFRLHFDLHRAIGLGLWPLLFVFAWSSVSFNLRSIYSPVMELVSDYVVSETPARPIANKPPTLAWVEALALTRAKAHTEAVRRGISIERERALYLDRTSNTYSYVVRTSRDLSDDGANSWFGFDGDTGRLLSVDLPTGEHTGNTVDYWLGILHIAGVLGLPYRIVVSLTGVAIVVLSVTGALIWLRKRRLRRRRANFGTA